MHSKFFRPVICCLFAAIFAGCATKTPVDYSAFKQSRPRSVVILPPLNESPDVNATYSMLSQMTRPLAESGYYVLPVAVVDETFKQNGLSNAHDIHEVAYAKLRTIFGADTALYVTVNQYGSTYTVLNSVVTVTATAKLVDLKSGTTLWLKTATADSKEGTHNNSSGGLIGALIAAAVTQIVNSTSDVSHDIAGLTSQRLLSAGQVDGVLYGPYSPKYGTD